MRLSIPTISSLGYTSLPAPLSTGGGLSFYEPSRETARLLLVPGADLVGWQISRLGDALMLTVETRGPLTGGVHYHIFIKTPDGVTHTYSLNDPNEHRSFSSFTTQVSLAELGNPSVLAFSAETQRDVVLDSIGWELILLDSLPAATPTPRR
jgi:hypothetical protein